MFVVQLIGALIVLILEAFNKTDFRQQLIYFYYRFGTSLHNPINPNMPIEHSRTLIYSLKTLFNQPKTQHTQHLDYLLDDTILYWYRIDCQIKVHLDTNIVYILTYNNILSVFQIQNQDLFDVEFYGFNKEIKLKLIYETKIQGEYYKSQLIGQELHIIMQEDQKYKHYLYIDNNLLQFKLIAEEKTIQFYSHDNYLLIISQTHNINYVASIRNQTDIQQLFRLFHKGQYMMNIPIMYSRNRDLVDFISIIIDDYSTKISFIHYQVSVNSGYGSSSTIFQEDASKLLDSQFRNKLPEFIKYTTYQDRIYLIIGQQHYFIKPYILGHDRYEVIKLKSSLESKNKVIDMKMNNQDLLILTYNFYSDTNQFYYLNLTQIQDNQELYLKLEDVKSYLNKLAILDFMILSQQNLSEILLIYESGDILVGQLQHPLYYQLFSWTSGFQGNVQKIGFPVFVTAIMELIRQGRQN